LPLSPLKPHCKPQDELKEALRLLSPALGTAFELAGLQGKSPRERLRALFDSLDSDGNGVLDEAELRSLVAKIYTAQLHSYSLGVGGSDGGRGCGADATVGEGGAGGGVGGRLGQAPENGTAGGGRGGSQDSQDGAKGQAKANDKASFGRRVSTSLHEAGLIAEANAGKWRAEAKVIFLQADADKNGTVDFEEFVDAAKHMPVLAMGVTLLLAGDGGGEGGGVGGGGGGGGERRGSWAWGGAAPPPPLPPPPQSAGSPLSPRLTRAGQLVKQGSGFMIGGLKKIVRRGSKGKLQ
jgi:hypothetical protein